MATNDSTFSKKIRDFLSAYKILLKNKRNAVIAYTVCTTLSGAASIIFDVFFIATVLDLLIKGASWNEILTACIAGAILVILRVVLSKIAEQLSVGIYTVNKAYMNIEIYKKSLDYSLKEYCNPEFYDSYKLVVDNGVDSINRALDIMTQLIQSVFLCVLFLTEFFRHNIVLVLIITAAFIVNFFTWNLIYKKQADIQYDNDKKLQQPRRACQYYERQFYLRESALDLKNKTLFDFISSKYTDSLSDLMKADKSARKRSFAINLINPIVNNTYKALIELIVVFAMFNMGSRDVSEYWELIALFSKMTSLYLFRCMGDFTTISNYMRSYREFFNHTAREKNNDIANEAPALEIHDVCFSYKPDDPFRLKNINISVAPKESVAIVGRNGSGKTTLMNLLIGAYAPDSGSISVRSKDGREIDLADYTPGMVMQEFNTYYTTIRNNITMGAYGFTDKEIADAATKANCDFLNDFEKPLDVSIGKEIDPEAIELSGGQSQRIALARCFLSRSSLILLDEPTAAIDPIFEKSLIAHLLEVMSARTSVIVTHRLDITQFIDRIYVMEDGEIVESGNFNELMSKKSIFKDMYESQRGIKV